MCKSINSGYVDNKILDTSNLQQRTKTFTNYERILKNPDCKTL